MARTLLSVKALPEHGFPNGFWVPWGRYGVPRRYLARVYEPPCELEIEFRDQRPTCVAIRAPEGLSGTILRHIPVDRIVKQATAGIAAADYDPWQGSPSEATLRAHGPATQPDATAAEYADRLQNFDDVHGPRPRRELNDAFLEKVADTHREGQRMGIGPTQHVADTLYGSRPAAGRWVMAARRRGLL